MADELREALQTKLDLLAELRRTRNEAVSGAEDADDIRAVMAFALNDIAYYMGSVIFTAEALGKGLEMVYPERSDE